MDGLFDEVTQKIYNRHVPHYTKHSNYRLLRTKNCRRGGLMVIKLHTSTPKLSNQNAVYTGYDIMI